MNQKINLVTNKSVKFNFKKNKFLYIAWILDIVMFITTSFIKMSLPIISYYELVDPTRSDKTSVMGTLLVMGIVSALTLLKIPLYFLIVKTKKKLLKIIYLILLLFLATVTAETIAEAIDLKLIYSEFFNLIEGYDILTSWTIILISFFYPFMVIFFAYAHRKTN